MSEEELIETLRVFEKNRVEQLEEPARNLFYAIMKIADERDRLNNIIKEAIEYIKKHGDYNKLSGCIEELDLYKINELLDILKGSDKE